MGWVSGLGIGLALGLRHALDADHLVAVTSMLSGGRRARAAIGVGFCWGAGHALTLTGAGVFVLATGWHFPRAWESLLEALVGCVILVLGFNVLRSHWRSNLHWHRHRHADRSHTHLHRHVDMAAADGSHKVLVHEHRHRGPSQRTTMAIGALHGLAGSGPLMILLALMFAAPQERYAALLASAVGSMAGMVLVTTAVAVPYLASRSAGNVWHGRLQLATGWGSVLYGLGFAIRALTAG
jgi:ABC-type nickel/cobalt efflux system permease component RcnA